MRKRILSIWLSVCMILTMLPISAMAEEADTPMGSKVEIIAFAPLDETEKSVSTGTSIEDLELPESLTATVRTAVTADSGTIEEPVQDLGNPEEDSASDNSAEATTSSAIQGDMNEQQESTDPEWKETTVDVPVTWTSETEYDMDTEGVYVFTPVIDGYIVSAELPKITVTVETQLRMKGMLMGAPDTYGDFSVNVISGDAPTFTDDVLTLGAGVYTVAMKSGVESTSNCIVVASGVTANITLDGVNINAIDCAFEVLGTANITLAEGTENTLKSGSGKAGLQVEPGATVIIDGTGKLTATGGDADGKGSGAGIGGGVYKDGGNITINGGSILATGGVSGAGIGGGRNGNGRTITINGGNITANGGNIGAGIGGGDRGSGGKITINGGTVLATGGWNGAGIGGGSSGDGGDVSINGGNITAKTGGGATGIGQGGNGSTSDGTLTIKSGLTVKGGDSESNAVVVTENYHNYKYLMIEPPAVINYDVWVGGVQVTSANASNITGDGLAGTVTYDPETSILTLNDATITGAYDNSSNKYGIFAGKPLTIIVTGTNTVTGVDVANYQFSYAVYGGETLNIGGTGTLNAKGGAALSGDSIGILSEHDLLIKDTVTVNAAGGTTTGGSSSSIGICSNTSNVTISGGTVTASGGRFVIMAHRATNSDTPPTLTNDQTVLVASTNEDGSNPVAYEADNIETYKYLKIGKPDTLNWSDGITTTTNTWDNGGEIQNEEELAQFGYNVNNGKSYEGQTVTLAKDIDLSGKEWSPIGNSYVNGFMGTFDGHGHSISGLTVNTTDSYAGLFGKLYTNSVVKNVNIASGTIQSTNASVSYAGGIAGYSYYSTILNCENHASVSSTITQPTNGSNCAGGIIGEAVNSSIKNCYNLGSIKAIANSDTDAAYAGGICGKYSGLSQQMDNCYSTGTVLALIQNGFSENTYAGGLVGAISLTSIKNSYYLQSSCSTGVAVINGSGNIAGCGTFDSEGALTAGTIAQFDKWRAQTLTYGNDLLAALNGWVEAQANTDYYTWIADSTTTPANGGYPVFGPLWAQPQAQWGVSSTDNAVPTSWVGSGTLAEAVTYANNFTSGTAYIKLLTNVDNTATLKFENSKTTVLDLNGKTIAAKEMNADQNDNNVIYVVNGKLTLCDSSDTDVTKQGKITNGHGYGDGVGGGVYVDTYGEFTMTGGNITGNTAGIGGGVANNGTFTMTGGNIAGNTCISDDNTTPMGGGVANNGTFTMTGGSITDNTVSQGGAAGGVLNMGIMYLSGNVNISGNKVGTANDNLTLIDINGTNSTISLHGALTSKTAIGVSILEMTGDLQSFVNKGGVFTSGDAVTNSEYKDKFTSDNSSFSVVLDGNQLKLAERTYTAPTLGTLTIGKTFTVGTSLSASDFDSYKPTVTANDGTITAQGWQQASIASDQTEADLSFADLGTGIIVPDTIGQYYLRYYVTYTDDSGASKTIYSNHVKLDVEGHTTVLSVTANPETSQRVNTEVALTATLTGYFAAAGVNGQTITFKNGTTTLGTANLNGEGVATLSWMPNTVGNYDITAEYAATAYNQAASSTALNYTVTADSNITTGNVSGKVTDSSGNPISGASVIIKVKIGDPSYYATTDAEGNYTIKDVPYGIYYIGVSYLSESKEINLVEDVAINSNNIVKNLQFLEGRRNTVVAVGSNTPSVAVGSLNNNYDDNLTEGEIDAVRNGGISTIRLQAIKKNVDEVSSDKTLMEAVATGKTLDFFIDLNVFKTIKDSDNNIITNEYQLSTLASVITIVIPIPNELQGKDGLSAYRVHNGVAQALAKDNADANGEYFIISADGKYLTIYTKSFSTYALGYTASGYTLTVNGSYASASGAGNYAPNATVSINAGTRSGYSFNGWTSTGGVTFANANSASTTFVMPAKNVTLTANWTYNGGSTGGGSAGGGSSYSYYKIKITKEGNGTISPDGGVENTVTIGEKKEQAFTFNPDKGYEISDILVDGKSVGAKESYTFKDVTKDHTIKVIFKATNTYVDPQTVEAFDDVNEKDWFADAVYAAVNNGWFSGTSKTTFSPYTTTTRGMIATVLYRMEKEPTVSSSSIFVDVLEGQYYTNGVNWAQANGIVAGYGNGKFGPQDNITREQMASILYRYAKFKGYDMSKTASLYSFTDGAFTSQYAKTPMAWAVANELISGKGNGILDPKAGATRAEVATILTKFDGMLTKK